MTPCLRGGLPPTAGPVPDETAPDPSAGGEHRVWRRTLASTWFAQMSAIVGFAFVMPFLRLFLRDELGVVDPESRASWASFIFAAPAVVMAFAAPLWGALADRVGRKVMVMRAMLGGAVVIALMGVATSPWHILGLRLAQGALTGTITAAAALVASVSPPGRGGFSMGMMQAAIFGGNAVGILMGGYVSDTLGYRSAFFIAALFLWAGGTLVALFAEEGSSHPRRYDRASDSRTPNLPCKGVLEAAGRRRTVLLEVLRQPAFLAIIGLMFVMNLSRAFPGALFQEYVDLFVEDKSRVNTTVGILHSTAFVVAAVTSVLMGRLADRVGYRVLVVAGTIAAGAFCIPQSWVASLPVLFVLRVLIGVAAGTVGPAMGKFIHSSVPRTSHGKAFGLVQSANSCSRGLGTFAGGSLNLALIPHVGVALALRIPFAVAGAFQLLVGLGAWAFVRRAAFAPGRGLDPRRPDDREP